MRLRVELFRDEETGQWGYAVPALSILGTGCVDRDEAQRLALGSVTAALESDDEIEDGADVVTLDVQISPVAEAS